MRRDGSDGAEKVRALRGRSAATAIGLILCLLASTESFAQTLQDASSAAIDNSYRLRADRARQEGAEARLRGAVEAFMPTITMQAYRPLQSRITYSPAQPAFPGVPDYTPRRDPSSAGVLADMPLFDGFRRWHTLQSARALADSGRLQSLNARQQVLLDTANAYLAVLRDTRILAYRESQIAAIRRIRDATEKQFEVNDATRTDVALTRSRVLEAEAARDRALADLAASRIEFKRQTRIEPERMVPPRFPDMIPRDEDAYASLVRDANPSLAAARFDARSASFLAEAQRADVLPSLNLQFSHYNQYGYSPATKRITDTTTQLVARVPIYEPGAQSRISEASALARQRGYEVQDTELATVAAARTAFQRRKAIADQLVKLTVRVAELRETMKGYEVERGAGFRTVLDELNIRAELADSEVATAIVLAERDGQSLQLAAAANLLDVGTSVPASRRFESIASIGAPPGSGPQPLVLRRLAGEPGGAVPVASSETSGERLRGTGAGRPPQPALRSATVAAEEEALPTLRGGNVREAAPKRSKPSLALRSTSEPPTSRQAVEGAPPALRGGSVQAEPVRPARRDTSSILRVATDAER